MVIFFLFSYQGSILIGIKKYVIRNEMFKYSALVSGIYIYIMVLNGGRNHGGRN